MGGKDEDELLVPIPLAVDTAIGAQSFHAILREKLVEAFSPLTWRILQSVATFEHFEHMLLLIVVLKAR